MADPANQPIGLRKSTGQWVRVAEAWARRPDVGISAWSTEQLGHEYQQPELAWGVLRQQGLAATGQGLRRRHGQPGPVRKRNVHCSRRPEHDRNRGGRGLLGTRAADRRRLWAGSLRRRDEEPPGRSWADLHLDDRHLADPRSGDRGPRCDVRVGAVGPARPRTGRQQPHHHRPDSGRRRTPGPVRAVPRGGTGQLCRRGRPRRPRGRGRGHRRATGPSALPGLRQADRRQPVEPVRRRRRPAGARVGPGRGP